MMMKGVLRGRHEAAKVARNGDDGGRMRSTRGWNKKNPEAAVDGGGEESSLRHG